MRREKHRKACHYIASSSDQRGQTRMFTFPVEIVRLEDNSFHLIVKVDIDGVAGDMIIDTGASVTVIDRKIFPDKISDESGIRMQSGSVTGQIGDVRIIQADCFKIWGHKVRNLQLAAIDLDYVNELYHRHLNRKIIGLLGCDFCVTHKAVINCRTKELTLSFSEDGREKQSLER